MLRVPLIHSNIFPSNSRCQNFRKYVYLLIEEPNFNIWSQLICFIIVTATLCQTLVYILDSVYSENPLYIKWSLRCECIVFTLFTLEYLIKISCCTAFGEGFWIYISKFSKLIDLICIFSLILTITIGRSNVANVYIIRIVSFTQILLILKISRLFYFFSYFRYIGGIKILFQAAGNCIKQFWLIMLPFIIALMSFSVAVFYSEKADPENTEIQINTLFDSMWLMSATITTIGYGDITPKTPWGRFFSGLCAFVGNTITLSLPIAVMGNFFSNIFKGVSIQKAYQDHIEKEQVEDTQIQQYLKNSHDYNDIKKMQTLHMYERVQQIEKNNQKISALIKKSNDMAKILTLEISKLFNNMDIQHSMPDLILKLSEIETVSESRYGIMKNKLEIYERILGVNQKITAAKLFCHQKDEDFQSNQSRTGLSTKKKGIKQDFIHRKKTSKEISNCIFKKFLEVTKNNNKVTGQKSSKLILQTSCSFDLQIGIYQINI